MYEQILADIANFKIRGDEIITKWGVLAFSLKVKDLGEKCAFISTYCKALENFKKEIVEIRPNEVSLENCLNYIFLKKRYKDSQTLDEIKVDVQSRLNAIEGRINYDLMKISSIGSKKIKKGFSVYTHGHSSLVLGILENAQKYLKFSLKITDAIVPVKDYFVSLSKFLDLTYYPFHMVETVVSTSDIILIGATAVNGNTFICQSGSAAVASIARLFEVPVYVVANTLKYSPNSEIDLEILDTDEVLMSVPKSVKVVANEFDALDASIFSGVISEEGILSWSEFLDLARKEYIKNN